MSRKDAQPYKKGKGEPGPAHDAMKRGKPAYLPNPQDIPRGTAKGARGAKGRPRSAFLDEMVRTRRS